jgi:hypothetical protein
MKVISRSFYSPKWDVGASELDEIPAEWKVFFRSAVNLTMPRRDLSDLVEELWINSLIFEFEGCDKYIFWSPHLTLLCCPRPVGIATVCLKVSNVN